MQASDQELCSKIRHPMDIHGSFQPSLILTTPYTSAPLSHIAVRNALGKAHRRPRYAK